MRSLEKFHSFNDNTTIKLQSELQDLYLSIGDVDSTIKQTISFLGKTFKYQQVFLYKYIKEDKTYIYSNNYTNSNTPLKFDRTQVIPILASYHDSFISQKIFTIHDKEIASYDIYRSYALSRKIASLVFIPLFVDKAYYGVIGFEDESEIVDIDKNILLVTSLSGILTNQISKYTIIDKLQKSESKYKTLYNNMSAAFTNCELIYDEDDNPIDYKFLDVNTHFEKITKMKASKWIGNTAKSLLADLEDGILNRAIVVVNTGEPAEFENFSDPFKKYFRYSIFKSGKNTFATLSYDITKEKEASLALIKSESKYRGLFESMESGFSHHEMIYDKNKVAIDYRYLEVNSKFEEITGISRDKWIGKTVKQVLPSLDNVWIENFAKVVDTGEAIEFENYEPTLKRYYNVIAYKTSDIGFATLSTDITQQKKATLELIKSEKKYKSLFESMESGFSHHEMIYDKDNIGVDFRYLEVNNKFKEIFYLKDEKWVGRTIKEIIPSFDEKYIKQYAQVVSTGKPVKIVDYSKYNKKHFAISAFKTSDNRFASITTDITHLKEVEARLSEEKESLRITLESIGDGLIATDNNGKITMINHIAEHLTGYKKHEAIGKDIKEVFDIYNISSNEIAENPITKVMQTGIKLTNSWYAKLKSKNNKKEYVISDTASPIKNDDGEVFGAILVFRDVTENKKRVDEIQFLSMHDPLTGLFNRSYLQNKLYEFDDRKDYPFSIIMGDANGLKITNDVFGHSEGDRLLVEISKMLTSSTGLNDIVSRWGGDEFVILMPDADEKAAEFVCHKINEACALIAKDIDEYSACPSISLGYATRTKKDRDILKVVKAAEDWMYKRKLLESKSAHSSIVASMRKTLFEKSHETEEHAERLNKYCRVLGKELNLSHQDIYDLELFSILHDIGKVAIDGRTLTKKGKLTDDEWEEIKRHPETGYRIANSAPELNQVAEFILTHHERWDGKGYPQLLSGEDIPIQSRILSIIDSFDAMTHDRKYRKALTLDAAIKEVKVNAGKQFDPNIVEIFLEKIVPIYEI